MITHKKIKVNDDDQLYFIGDIHGDYGKFLKLLSFHEVEKNDYIVGTGDIVDRGNQITPCCFDFLYKNNYDMVLGNHEMMMIESKDKATFIDWTWNGGDKTLQQLGEKGVEVVSQLMLEKFPLILEVEHRGMRFGVIHADIPYRYGITDWNELIEQAHTNKKLQYDLFWSRQSITNINKSVNIKSDVPPIITGIDYVIHGHTGVEKPLLFGNRMWIDTGFVKNSLTLATFDHDIKKWIFLYNESTEY